MVLRITSLGTGASFTTCRHLTDALSADLTSLLSALTQKDASLPLSIERVSFYERARRQRGTV
jgi:hypothetical protein